MVQQPMMMAGGGPSTNTNTNNIKIDLGELVEKKEDKETNIT